MALHTQPWAQGLVLRMVLNVSRKLRRLVFLAFFQSQKLRLERAQVPQGGWVQSLQLRTGWLRNLGQKHRRREPLSAGWCVLKCWGLQEMGRDTKTDVIENISK